MSDIDDPNEFEPYDLPETLSGSKSKENAIAELPPISTDFGLISGLVSDPNYLGIVFSSPDASAELVRIQHPKFNELNPIAKFFAAGTISNLTGLFVGEKYNGIMYSGDPAVIKSIANQSKGEDIAFDKPLALQIATKGIGSDNTAAKPHREPYRGNWEMSRASLARTVAQMSQETLKRAGNEGVDQTQVDRIFSGFVKKSMAENGFVHMSSLSNQITMAMLDSKLFGGKLETAVINAAEKLKIDFDERIATPYNLMTEALLAGVNDGTSLKKQQFGKSKATGEKILDTISEELIGSYFEKRNHLPEDSTESTKRGDLLSHLYDLVTIKDPKNPSRMNTSFIEATGIDIRNNNQATKKEVFNFLKSVINITVLGGTDTIASSFTSLLYELTSKSSEDLDLANIMRREYEDFEAFAKSQPANSQEGKLTKKNAEIHMPVTSAFLRENRRKNSPTISIIRAAIRDTTVTASSGTAYIVPKGTVFVGNIVMANRNKSIFGEDADQFNVERYLKFTDDGHYYFDDTGLEDDSFGDDEDPRICPGKALAEIQELAMLGVALKRYDIKSLSVRTEGPVTPVVSATLNTLPSHLTFFRFAKRMLRLESQEM